MVGNDACMLSWARWPEASAMRTKPALRFGSPWAKTVRGVRDLTNRLARDRSGVTATEYGLLLAGVAIMILVAVFAMGDALDGVFIHVGSVLRENS